MSANCLTCTKELPEFEQENGTRHCWLCDMTSLGQIYPIVRTSQEGLLSGMISFYDDEEETEAYKNAIPCKGAFLSSFEDRFSRMQVELYLINISNMNEFMKGLGESVIIRPAKEFIIYDDFPQLSQFDFFIEIYDDYTE